MSHYFIWKLIVDTNEQAIIMEHDGKLIDNVPVLSGDIVNLGKPSWGLQNVKPVPMGEHVLASFRCFAGTHGYYVTPVGAKILIEKAKQLGYMQADEFLSTKYQGDILKEYHPPPIIAEPTFTTIQANTSLTIID